MSVDKVKEYLKAFGKEDILEFDESTATVELAAEALGVKPEQIAKTIALRGEEDNQAILVVAAGDAKVDNRKFRDEFGIKPRMLSFQQTADLTGHKVGGVCPFALPKEGITLRIDESLKRFETVYPAAGSSNTCIKLTLDELTQYTDNPGWVDVCKDWQ